MSCKDTSDLRKIHSLQNCICDCVNNWNTRISFHLATAFSVNSKQILNGNAGIELYQRIDCIEWLMLQIYLINQNRKQGLYDPHKVFVYWWKFDPLKRYEVCEHFISVVNRVIYSPNSNTREPISWKSGAAKWIKPKSPNYMTNLYVLHFYLLLSVHPSLQTRSPFEKSFTWSGMKWSGRINEPKEQDRVWNVKIS